MGKLQNYLRDKLGIKVETKDPDVPFTSVTGNTKSSQDLDKEAQLNQYESWTYAAVSKIANDCSNVALTLNKIKTNGDVEEVKKHPVLDLLDFVNDYSTYSDLVETTKMYENLAGDAFWLLILSGGKPVEIWQYLRPDLMGVVPSKTKFISHYTYKIPGEGTIKNYAPEEIIMFKKPNPFDPYRGKSPVKAAQFAIATDKKASEWNWRFFNNSARADMLISYPEGIDEKQAKQIKTQWENAHKGTAHSQKIGFLSGDAKIQQLGMTQKDMDFLQQRKFSRDEILSMYKVPKALLDPQELNFASAKVAQDVYNTGVIEPEMRRFVNTLNEFLLPFYNDDSLFFDFVSPKEADRETELKTYEVLSRARAISVNEIRQAEGLETIEGGDEIVPVVAEGEVTGDTTGKTRKKKYNVRVKSRSKKLEAVEDIKKELEFSDIFTKKEIKKALKVKAERTEHDKFAQRYWEKQIEKLDKEEVKFKKELDEEFVRQEKQTLKQLAKKTVSDIDFNVKEETKIIREKFRPFVTALIAFSGEDALNDIGLDGFDVDKTIQDYIVTDGLAFAKEINDTTKEKLNKEIAKGVADGESTKKIGKRITGVYTEAKTSRANNIARTEVAKSTNYGTLEGWKQSGVVEAKEWFTALDDRVCPICAPLHGSIIGLNKNFSAPDGFGSISGYPAHQMCRCALLPITVTKQQQLINLKKKEDELQKVINDNKDKTDSVVEEVKVNAEKEIGKLRDINKKLKKTVDEDGE